MNYLLIEKYKNNDKKLNEIINEKRKNLVERYQFIKDDKKLKTNCEKAREYRKSESYKILRNTRLIKDNKKCTKCGSIKNLCLHHITYKNYYKESIEDVVILCRMCHNEHHRIERLNKNTFNKERKMLITEIKRPKTEKETFNNYKKNKQILDEYMQDVFNHPNTTIEEIDETWARKYKCSTRRFGTIRRYSGVQGPQRTRGYYKKSSQKSFTLFNLDTIHRKKRKPQQIIDETASKFEKKNNIKQQHKELNKESNNESNNCFIRIKGLNNTLEIHKDDIYLLLQ